MMKWLLVCMISFAALYAQGVRAESTECENAINVAPMLGPAGMIVNRISFNRFVDKNEPYFVAFRASLDNILKNIGNNIGSSGAHGVSFNNPEGADSYYEMELHIYGPLATWNSLHSFNTEINKLICGSQHAIPDKTNGGYYFALKYGF